MKVFNTFSNFILGTIFLFVLNVSYSQIQEGGKPYSYSISSTALRKNNRVEKMPGVDENKLRIEDEKNKNQNIPFRFGKTFEVNYSLENSGTWEELSNGDRLWTLNIESPGAHSINLTFGEYYLPSGAKLFIFNKEKSMHIGAFTSANNQEDGKLGTRPVKGDAITVEYYEPQFVRGQGRLNISNITHAYKDIFYEQSTGFNGSAECHINVNCPDGAEFQNEKRSVVLIMMNGSLCSGALINNTSQDGTPYVLTARHCFNSEPSTWVFVFNYESPDCSNIDGSLSQSIAGAEPKAGDADSDFFLVELSSRPPQSYNAYYAGWSRSTIAPTSGVGIHHPAGDIKKISTSNASLTKGGWGFSILQSHWFVNGWNNGSNEGGSSGSPIFDQNKRIVGQLQGGTVTTCPGSAVTSKYGGIFYSWDKSSIQNASYRLKDWLDPGNTGAISMDGSYLGTSTCISPVAVNSINASLNPVCAGSSFKLSLMNIPSGVGINYQWQYSEDNVNWFNILNANASSHTTSQTVSTYYRCNISCSASTTSSASILVTMDPSSCTFLVPSTGTNSVTTCSGKMYDNGGTSNYTNNGNGTLTINPATVGNKVKLNFTSFQTESGKDNLYIYDGPTSASPLIGTYNGTLNAPPSFVYSTHPSGAITLRFTSDDGLNYSGFVANISCEESVPMPDLTITTASANPSNIPAGTSTSISCNLYNGGNGQSRSTFAKYYLSTNSTYEVTDISLGSTSAFVSLATNYPINTSVAIPANTVPGNYYILFLVDRDSTVWESNELNNMFAVAITITPTVPDLVIQSPVVSSTSADVGFTISASCVIKNNGAGNAVNSNVGYYLSADNVLDASDVLLNNSTGTGLASGATASKSTSITIPLSTNPGAYYLLFVADYTLVELESNESNNVVSIALTVLPAGSTILVPKTGTANVTTCSGTVYDSGFNSDYENSSNGVLTINPGNPGEKVRLTFTSFRSEADYDKLFIYNGNSTSAPLIGTYHGTVNPGTIYGSLATGALTLKFTSDGTATFSGFAATIGCVATIPAPDLVILTPTVSATTIAAGASINASCSIRNIGDASASSSTVGYYLSVNDVWEASDVYLGNSPGVVLNVATSATKTGLLPIPVNTVPGDYYIIYYADYANAVAEGNESNNFASKAITVTPPTIDLFVANGSLTPNSVDAGFTTSAFYNIGNQGSAPSGASTLGFYLSENNTYEPEDVLLTTASVGSINSGFYSSTTGTLTIPAATIPGAYYILYFIDHSSVVTETLEINNVFSLPITITPFASHLSVPYTGTTTVTTCTGTVYDSGINSNYFSNSLGTLTINPSVAGNKLELTFTSFNTESTYDKLSIYNGTNTSAPLIGTYSGTTSPGVIYGTSASGALTLRFTSDGGTVYSGFSANINCVSTIPKADLIIQSPNTPSTIYAGNTASLSCTVANIGGLLATSSNVGYYLSSDAIWDINDLLLGTSAGGSLNKLSSEIRSSDVTIPVNTNPGNYYIIYLADHTNVLDEDLETNNYVYGEVSINPPVIDLGITNNTLSSNAIDAGGSITASCMIRNYGGANTATSNVGFYLSSNGSLGSEDLLLNIANGTSLSGQSSASRSATIAIPDNIAPGNYYIFFYADHLNLETESDENNNLAIVSLTVRPVGYTNIVPASGSNSITLCSGTVYDNGGSTGTYADNSNGELVINPATVGGKIKLTITAFNMEANYDYFYVYNGPSSSSALIGKYTGTTVLSSFTSTHESGALTIKFTSDGSGTNVGFGANISCVSPDLLVQSISINLTTVAAGNTINVSSTIINLGTMTASSSSIGYYLSKDAIWDEEDIYLGYSPGTSLVTSAWSNKSETLTIPPSTLAGNYYVAFYADYTNAVTEMNKSNNVIFEPLEITLPPYSDLSIQSLSASPTSVLAGSTIESNYSVHNAGTASVNTIDVGYYLSSDATLDNNDLYLGASTVTSIGIGSSIAHTSEIVIPDHTPAGSYYLLFVADYEFLVSESDETNNVTSVAITITEPKTVDLYLQSATLSSTSVVKGASLNISYAIHNSGTGEAYSSKVGYYLSVDAVWDEEDLELGSSIVGALTSGGSEEGAGSILIPDDISAGTYYILWYADHDGSVTESDETNNISSAELVVVNPTIDLVIKSPMVSASVIETGASIDVFYDIKNFGSINSNSSNVAFYLSLDNIWDANDVFLNNSNGSLLESMSSSSRSATVIIPQETNSGDYYILIFADYENAELESIENNNVGSSAISVLTPNALIQPLSSILLVNPNPTDGVFDLTMVGLQSGNAEIFIYNPLGILIERKAATINNGDLNENLDLTSYPADVYTLKVLYRDKQTVTKIVVQ